MVLVLEEPEPERADARQDASLIRDARRQDPVERADAVGGHDQETAVAQVVNVADLPAALGEPAAQLRLQQCHAAQSSGNLPTISPGCLGL